MLYIGSIENIYLQYPDSIIVPKQILRATILILIFNIFNFNQIHLQIGGNSFLVLPSIYKGNLCDGKLLSTNLVSNFS